MKERERKRETDTRRYVSGVTKMNVLLGLIAAHTASGEIVTKFYCQEVDLAPHTRTLRNARR